MAAKAFKVAVNQAPELAGKQIENINWTEESELHYVNAIMVALRKGKIMSESNPTFDFSSVHPRHGYAGTRPPVAGYFSYSSSK